MIRDLVDVPATTAEGYPYASAAAGHQHAYLLPALDLVLEKCAPKGGNLFEIGAGNGFVANELARRGYTVSALEPSTTGVGIAQKQYPRAGVFRGSIYDNLGPYYGRYDFVFALEVIEHLYAPRELVVQAKKLLKQGGYICLSTPFHGYWKNLALALSNKFDKHFGPLWDHGHIKFWSATTLSQLLREGGFDVECVIYVGRVYPFSKSMVIYGRAAS